MNYRLLTGFVPIATGSLLSGLLAAIALPALAVPNQYSLDSKSGEVRVYRGNQQVRRVYSGMPLLPGDEIWVARSRASARVRCPNGQRYRAPATGSRVPLGRICPPPVSRSGPRGGDDLLASATGTFVTKTFVVAEGFQVSWPAVPQAQRYRLTMQHLGQIIWRSESDRTTVAYGGAPLTDGSLYGLSVEAIGANGQLLSTYRLKAQVLDATRRQALKTNQAAIDRDAELDSLGKAIARADLAARVGQGDTEPELWWQVLAEFTGPIHNGLTNIAVSQRRAIAYIHLGRNAEARASLDEIFSIVGTEPSLERAIALELLGQVMFLENDKPGAIARLREAQRIYTQVGETTTAGAIASVLDK